MVSAEAVCGCWRLFGVPNDLQNVTSLGRLKRVCGNTFVCGDGGGSLWCVLVFDQSPPGYLG